MKNSYTREMIADLIMKIQLFYYICDMMKCLRLNIQI